VSHLVIPPVWSAPWPQWFGPARNGITPEAGWKSAWPPDGPPILWQQTVGTGFSCLSVAEGRAYTLGYGEGQDVIYCFNAETGEEIWRYTYPCAVYADRHEGGPASTPSVDEDRLYCLSREARVNCLETATGRLIWTRELAKDHDLKIPLLGFTSSPLVTGNLVLVDVGCAIALDKKTGATVWTTEKYIESYSSPSAVFRWPETPVSSVVQPHAAFFNGTGLVVLRLSDGRETWKKLWRTPQFDTNTSTPQILEDRVFITSGFDRGCALLKIGSASESSVIWEDPAARSHSNTPILWEGHLYGFFDKELKCLVFETGQVKWTEPMPDAGCQILADGILLILTEKGELITAEASPDQYQEFSRTQALGGRCWTLPVLSEGRIYCRNSRGDVVCLDVRP
jgi:outer membrane protein assembly factor BamB